MSRKRKKGRARRKGKALRRRFGRSLSGAGQVRMNVTGTLVLDPESLETVIEHAIEEAAPEVIEAVIEDVVPEAVAEALPELEAHTDHEYYGGY